MKLYLLLFITLCFFMGCDKTQESSENTSDTASTEKQTDGTGEREASQKSSTGDPYLELTFTGGPLDGRTLKATPKYKVSEQTILEEGQKPSFNFARFAVEGTSLEIGFDYMWAGKLSEGLTIFWDESRSELDIYNAEKGGEYDFVRLSINFTASKMRITKVEDWQEEAGKSYTFYEGEGTTLQTEVEKFTSGVDKTKEASIKVAFKFRAKAIK
ncbi:MAG: hypothetical protein ACFB0B_09665 [Thermonemataceae bacterium]